MIHVSDLKDQLGQPGPRPFLFCTVCGTRASASSGDYFMAPPDHVFRCCNLPMILATEQRTITEVQVADKPKVL